MCHFGGVRTQRDIGRRVRAADRSKIFDLRPLPPGCSVTAEPNVRSENLRYACLKPWQHNRRPSSLRCRCSCQAAPGWRLARPARFRWRWLCWVCWKNNAELFRQPQGLHSRGAVRYARSELKSVLPVKQPLGCLSAQLGTLGKIINIFLQFFSAHIFYK